MVALTLSPDQIRNAPPEVQRWLEHELLASLGLGMSTAEPNAPSLVACSSEEASMALALLQGMIPVVSVFFELGREGASTGIEGVTAFRLDDIVRHTRLQTLEQIVACLDTINEAVRQVRGDRHATFYGLDSRGYCFITERTQHSIARIWQELISARKSEPIVLRSPQPGVQPFAVPDGGGVAPSCPIDTARPLGSKPVDRPTADAGS